MHRIIPLWPGEAPYTEHSPDRFQPFIKEFRVEGSRGAVIVCPGGGYMEKCGYEGDPVCEMLNAAGISAYTLDYRIFPCHLHAPLTDAKRAIRLVRSMGYEKVGILGFSAGGHLSCCAATLHDPGTPDAEDPVERLSSRPDAFVPCYAVTSLRHFPHLAPHMPLLKDHFRDPEVIRMYSPEENVAADTPPAFIWHTASDELVPVRNSLLLAESLAAHAVPFKLIVFPEGRHGLALSNEIPEVTEWAGLCQNWLIAQGFAQ